MKTTKPISSISWNSRNYLVDRLEELRKAHLIAFWVLVKHTAEEDEKKDILNQWNLNEKNYQNAQKEKYNYDNIFAKKKENTT